MGIEKIQTFLPAMTDPGTMAKAAAGAETPAEPFGQMVSNMLDSVNDLQTTAGKAQEAFLNGDAIDLHEVMIKAEEAGISMDLLLEIRNKLVNGYNDLIRMPM